MTNGTIPRLQTGAELVLRIRYEVHFSVKEMPEKSKYKTEYPSPACMRRGDGSSRFAYVTFLLFNVSHNYVESAMTMAYSLKLMKTQADIICLVTAGMPDWAGIGLETVFDDVIEVDAIYLPHCRRHRRPEIPFVFTRFHALRLGADGDLGFQYDKFVLLDADVLPLRSYDHLFSLPSPAGIINETKDNFRDYDVDGTYIIPGSAYEDGTWKWHRIYNPICPHGAPIPKYITDRPRYDFGNLGIIGALFVINPSMLEFQDIMQDIQQPEIRQLICEKFPFPDMQYSTIRWSGLWTNVDLRFCALNGYPNLGALCGTHYAGCIKPWSIKKESALESYSRFEDFQLWYQLYTQMMRDFPQLRKIKHFHSVDKVARRLIGKQAWPTY